MSFELPELPFHEAGLIFAVLTAVILLAPSVARRLRLPDIIVVVLLGFAVGPDRSRAGRTGGGGRDPRHASGCCT